mgnify:FL=1
MIEKAQIRCTALLILYKAKAYNIYPKEGSNGPMGLNYEH